MGLPETAEFERMVDSISKAIDRLPNQVAAEAVNFSKERFVQQNWLDEAPEPWKQRGASWKKDKRTGRALLVDTARLKRSIRKIMSSPTMIIIGTDVPYAQIHNDGGRYKAVQEVKSYHRRGYSVKESTRTRAGREERVRAHNVSASTVKSFKRTLNGNMPRRRFLGASATLNRRLETFMATQISKAITDSLK